MKFGGIKLTNFLSIRPQAMRIYCIPSLFYRFSKSISHVWDFRYNKSQLLKQIMIVDWKLYFIPYLMISTFTSFLNSHWKKIKNLILLPRTSIVALEKWFRFTPTNSSFLSRRVLESSTQIQDCLPRLLLADLFRKPLQIKVGTKR